MKLIINIIFLSLILIQSSVGFVISDQQNEYITGKITEVTDVKTGITKTVSFYTGRLEDPPAVIIKDFPLVVPIGQYRNCILEVNKIHTPTGPKKILTLTREKEVVLMVQENAKNEFVFNKTITISPDKLVNYTKQLYSNMNIKLSTKEFSKTLKEKETLTFNTGSQTWQFYVAEALQLTPEKRPKHIKKNNGFWCWIPLFCNEKSNKINYKLDNAEISNESAPYIMDWILIKKEDYEKLYNL